MTAPTPQHESRDEEEVPLDPARRSSEIVDFERRLLEKVVGQGRAIGSVVNIHSTFMAKMPSPNRPISNLLFLGPTGSGKTRVVEAYTEILFDKPDAFTKIDCAEFQHSHEISKLIGAPPGYLGHRETRALLSQEVIDQHQTGAVKMSVMLFDEIEKANESLWQLLLGILDKGVLTLGDNRKVDLTRTVIFMTSNLGAREMKNLQKGGIGFKSANSPNETDVAETDQRLYKIAMDAAQHRFAPEFMNRLDKVVVFRTLSPDDLRQILNIELADVQKRITNSQGNNQFLFHCTDEVKKFLLAEGTDAVYGARHLKRAIERFVVRPLSDLINSGQIGFGDRVKVGIDGGEMVFLKKKSHLLVLTPLPKPRADDTLFGREFVGTNGERILADNRHVFQGLYIKTRLEASETHPVIQIRLAKTLVVVGFTEKHEVVIQIDGGLCVTFPIEYMRQHFRFLRD